MARRLSEIISSPLKLMERVGEHIADYIVGPEPPPPPENQPPSPQELAKVVVAKKPRAVPAASRKKIVKQEAQRELPFRSSSRRHKEGFYSESNLASLAWRGTGTAADPIRFD